MLPPPPRSTLFPYTTLFRSQHADTGRYGGSRWFYGCRFARENTPRTDRQSEKNAGDERAALCSQCTTLSDRKSTRLNSSHVRISYAVFCLKKKKKNKMISIY